MDQVNVFAYINWFAAELILTFRMQSFNSILHFKIFNIEIAENQNYFQILIEKEFLLKIRFIQDAEKNWATEVHISKEQR